MKKDNLKNMLTPEDKQTFQSAIGKVKTIVQDKIQPARKNYKSKAVVQQEKQAKQQAQFYFSDEFEPDLNQQGPIKYVREGVDTFEIKNLRRGQYVPDLILDLHGLDQHQAKQELAALLYACQKEHAHCICIVHGIGSRVLKRKVPHWLVQHPDIMAFHQAPLEWGGAGAILALVELQDKFNQDVF